VGEEQEEKVEEDEVKEEEEEEEEEVNEIIDGELRRNNILFTAGYDVIISSSLRVVVAVTTDRSS